jgi:pimeloyl-ACP methyl ester carboxylesterase
LLIEPSVHGLRAITPSAIAMTLRARLAKLRGGARAATDVAYRWTFTYRGLGRNAWDEMPDAWRSGVLDHAAAVAAEEPHEIALRYPPSAALSRLDLPVTIVVGERSQPYFHRIARRLQRLIPTARLHETADASHAAHLDSPAEVAALLG